MKPSTKNLQRFELEELESIDRICIRFEDEWVAGREPEIDDFLPSASEVGRSAVLMELVRLDLEYRLRRDGSTPAVENYLARFRHDSDAIRSAYSEFIASSQQNAERDTQQPPGGSLLEQQITFNSRYDIVAFHARGGLGEVYIAKDLQLERTVAIKIPRSRDINSQEHIRLRREAAITGRLKHPGIVPVFGISSDDTDLPCYAMQLIEGQTLKKSTQEFHRNCSGRSANRFQNWEFRKLLQNLISVGNTVAYAHEQGVIHRDIKPENIMLGEFGETFLLDWGLARTIDAPLQDHSTALADSAGSEPDSWPVRSDSTEHHTRPGQPIGTPGFASPEQVAGQIERQGIESDVYSLGATLFFLMQGRSMDVDPAQPVNSVPHNSNTEAHVPLFDSLVPAELVAICRRAVAFDPEHRYPDVASFNRDLERFLADERVSVGGQSTVARIRRFARKYPRTLFSALTAVAVTLAALAISSWLFADQAQRLSDSLAAQVETSNQLRAARETSDQRAAQTRTALRTMSNRLMRHWFASRPEFTQHEQQLLDDIVQQYRQFSALSTDSFSERMIQAESWQRVGRIQLLIGRDDDAMESFSRMAELTAGMPADADPKWHLLRLTGTFDLGSLQFSAGDTEEGLKTMESAVESLAELVRDHPDEAEFMLNLAQARDKLGTFYVVDRQPQKAIEQKKAATESLRQLVLMKPGNVAFQSYLATTLTALAIAKFDNGELELALSDHESAAEVFENQSINKLIFRDLDLASGYIMNLSGTAMVLSRMNRIDEAQGYYEQARDAATRVTDDYPSFADGFFALAAANRGLQTNAHITNDNVAAADFAKLAVEAVSRALELSPDNPRYLEMRADCQLAFAAAIRLQGELELSDKEFASAIEYARRYHQAVGDADSCYILAESMYLRGLVLAKLENREAANSVWREAVTELEAGLAAYPQNPELTALADQINDRLK